MLKRGSNEKSELWELRYGDTILATMNLYSCLLHYAYFNNFQPAPSFEQYRHHFEHIQSLINDMSDDDWDLNYPDHIRNYYDQHIRRLNWVVFRQNSCYLLKNFWMQFEDNGMVLISFREEMDC